MSRRWTALGAALGLCAALLPATLAAAGPATDPAAATAGGLPLTNLAHLDELTTTVTPPDQAGHTTYRLDDQPGIGVLWVYADHQDDGSYRKVGGGAYDPATDTYEQGAYDADDISRAAVVYLRQWRATGDEHARDQAYSMLRGLTYMQTATGPNAGEVVLWMQPDGTLNPSAKPREEPDPSDSDDSYWLARTIWALGEGYAAYEKADPGFAAFLRERLDLAVKALNRDAFDEYGEYLDIDGVRTPAWLIADGADASAEAVLGLTAYAETAPDSASRDAALRATSRLAEGIGAMSGGKDTTQWPFGAAMPWATSRSIWHGWGAQMPAALARAADVLDEPRLLDGAVRDAAVFTPDLLTSSGPDNGLLPTPVDRSQIAYGADSRVQSLLAVAEAADRPGLRRLAGFAAGWFFGQNRSGTPVYDPQTGVTFDGVEADGRINRNSGAESTIHGLLTMQALDAAPDLRALAGGAASHVVERDGRKLIEAESGEASGGAETAKPESAWTGESQWSGGAYSAAGPGSTLSWQLPEADQPRSVQVVADLAPGSKAVTRFTREGSGLGVLDHGAVGPQSDSPAPGALLPTTLDKPFPAQAGTLTARTTGGTGRIDALMLQPLVSRLVLGQDGTGAALLHSSATTNRTVEIEVPGGGEADIRCYDASGQQRTARTDSGQKLRITLPPGGFALVTR